MEELRQKIRQLEDECSRLRAENTRLRALTEQDKPKPAEAILSQAESSGGLDQFSSPAEKIALFRSLFRGREDVYPVRWQNSEGKAGYAPTCKKSQRWKAKEDRQYFPVSDDVVRQHLSGKIIMGIYPVLPDDRCWFLAVDFDKKTWRQDCTSFLESCEALGIPAALECSRSGNGGHVWIFFAEPVTANLARRLGAVLLTHCMEARPELGLDSYDRFFPSQDTLPKGGFGNLIALPLQKYPRQHGGSVFLDRNLEPYEDQWKYLGQISRIGTRQLEKVVSKAESMGDLLGVRRSFDADTGNETPWELKPSETFCAEPINGKLPDQVTVTKSNQLFVEKKDLPPAMINRIIRLAAFHNPEFYKMQSMRLSAFRTPRVIHCANDFPKHIGLPRGSLQDLETLCSAHGMSIHIEDKCQPGSPLKTRFLGELRKDQKRAVRAVMKHNEGIICAATAFGKTVVAAHLIARRKTNTLVIVHRRQLLDQWKERLATFLEIDAKSIGQIGGGKNKPTKEIDVAIIQSLNRKGVVKDIVADYGHVIVDECHHISAVSFEQVMGEVKARYVTGLTATPERKDGHHPIIHMQCGPTRFRMTAKAQAKLRPFRYKVFPVPTLVRFDSLAEQPGIHEFYQTLMTDERRNHRISKDVAKAISEGRNPLVLTERIQHIAILEDLLRDKSPHIVVLRGGMGKKQREAVTLQMETIPENESRVIIATGRYIGEGFDDSRLDTLFLAMPISWKGTLQQYAGRLHRLHEGKEEVRIYDYVDDGSPMLASMFRKRLKGYANMGYEVHDPDQADLKLTDSE